MLAVNEDIPQIVALGYKSFYENGLDTRSGVTPDFDKTGTRITNCVQMKTVFVLKTEDRVDGVLVMEPSSTWWSNDQIFNVLLLFVKEDKRSLKAVIELINEAKKYAIMYNTPIVSGMSAEKDAERKVKLLKYLGFKPFGSNLVFTP